MFGWSLPIGRIFGVQVRLHYFFLLLLFLSVSWSSYLEQPMLRGVVLWALLLLAVAVREAARGLAAAWFGIELRTLLLLPTGGIPGYATPSAIKHAGEPRVQRTMALVGPLTSIAFGLALGGLVLAVSPSVSLLQSRWVTPEHLLRAMVWINLLLAAVNFLPAWPLDAGRVMQGEMLRSRRDVPGADGRIGSAGTAGANLLRVGPAIAVGLIVYGIVSRNFLIVMAGVGVLLGAQVERRGLLVEASSDTVKVSDVMLTDYTLLSASATLEDAVDHARHTLQDVFPVVRAGNMVGAVSRGDVLGALEATGNGYVQGIMARSFETAAPDDSLVETLSRVTAQAGASSQLVPVVSGERIVGILTPQNLQRSMGLLVRRPAAQTARQNSSEDEL